jgi:maleate isomerase
MTAFTEPAARLGIILSSGNRTLEPYFRALAPAGLGIHVTRMHMGSGGKRARGDIEAAALQCAELLADARVDAIDLQGTGIMMERGPDGEAELVARIAAATKTPVYTATQAVVEALRALQIARVVVVNPGDAGAVARERAYLEAVGIDIVHALARDCGEATLDVTPEQWAADARAAMRACGGKDTDGFFLSGSHTRMVGAIAAIEGDTGKPVVTSIQAALWVGLRRLGKGLGPNLGYGGALPDVLGRLFRTDVAAR